MIGLGRVGQGYDYRDRDASRVLTHAQAFAVHRAYELVGGVDTDLRERRRFGRKFNRPAYPTVAELFAAQPLDVIAVSVPTPAHHQVFLEVLKGRPRAVLCEKPLAATVALSRTMLRAAKRHRCVLAVNYMRRFEPGALRLRRMLQAGRLGTVYKGTVWYSKGLLNNGSHFVDLLRFLIGEVRGFEIMASGRDCGDSDAEPDVRMVFGNCVVDFLAAREECFSIAEMELFATGGRIRYLGGGTRIEIWRAVRDRAYAGYRTLTTAPLMVPGDFARYQWHVVDQLQRHLTRGTPLHSDGVSAGASLRVVQRILESREHGKHDTRSVFH